MTEAKTANVFKVYSGRPGCMCGCRGSWRYATAHRAYGEADRGYAIDDKEINDRQVKRVTAMLAADPNTAYDESAKCFFPGERQQDLCRLYCLTWLDMARTF